MRSGRSLGADKHRARGTVTSDRYDLAISYMDVLGEGNAAEDCLNEPDDFNTLQDAGQLIEARLKRRRAAICVRGELADGIRMKRKGGGVVSPNCIDVFFDYLNHVFAQGTLRIIFVVLDANRAPRQSPDPERRGQSIYTQ